MVTGENTAGHFRVEYPKELADAGHFLEIRKCYQKRME